MLNEKFQSARPGGTVKFRIPEPAERMGANFIRYIFFFLIHSTHKKMIIFVFNEKKKVVKWKTWKEEKEDREGM